jgi:hypothetical protein
VRIAIAMAAAKTARRMTLRRAAIGALLVFFGLGNVAGVLFLAAFQLRLEWFADPSAMVAAGPGSAELLRWGAVADLFGYYLATGVVAYVVWTALRPIGPAIADFATLSALGYVLAGGAAAASLAFAGPLLMHQYASGEDPAAVAVAFGVLTEVVFSAVWQFLDAWLLAGWWLGIGILLRRIQPGFAGLSLALAAIAAIASVFTLLDVGIVRYASLGVFFVLWTAWSAWLLVLLWRRMRPFTELG